MTTSPSTSSAIVFKEYSDIYNSAIERARFRPIFVPVLNSIHGDIDELARVMSDGAGAYDGVVVTSQRAVEAWKSAAEVAQNAPMSTSGDAHARAHLKQA
ncbi:hypothetical protein E3P92_02568 [Wallemia ichthyophaga]|uniref:Tetrapyrrole biosynthesis uroporphyrinogen III synthase domain-containing protein n=1 Tax=Wallemia ichthyophaga TaxID=245174 RepID=A0A4T0HDH3_WALIC|nr:hypothetical protein E3P91_02991 [Wallemia ichthyophaga]TIA81009.1 hypothetical protein E3P98_02324 [Wallemia ichthyophaga]TIA90269.1 hypothetical protein E3P97_02646 [Wallemia ichthyophaga]TIA98882.1 hypothetical protein E3P95_02290 [Wallemia ichthyophaga]TIB00064.1 hypothetical protein E3P94_02347 [Wallemia ichthyophaga]